MHVSSFFFNDTATTEIYTLSLHDALPIFGFPDLPVERVLVKQNTIANGRTTAPVDFGIRVNAGDRKSTRLNSSHANISYAVFCLKKKNKKLNKNTSLISQL